ncbi:MAG TPA: hypothetical protein VF747_03310, partial [Blastocatellia bacterium]
RSFEAREATGTEREVTLRMGKPIPDPKEGGDWCCPYQIIGLGDDKVSAAFGVDPLQALLLALQKAGAELSYYQRVQNIKLTWLDDEDLGLPKL